MHAMHVLYLFSMSFLIPDHQNVVLSASYFVKLGCLRCSASTTCFNSSGITSLLPKNNWPNQLVSSLKMGEKFWELVPFDCFVSISSIATLSDQPNFCGWGSLSQPWSRIQLSLGFTLFQHLLSPVFLLRGAIGFNVFFSRRWFGLSNHQWKSLSLTLPRRFLRCSLRFRAPASSFPCWYSF